MESFADHGERVAGLLVRALDGQLAGAPVIEPAPPSKCLADGRQLQRFGLDARALPAGCEVRFVEASFLQRYAWASAAVVLALGAQSALIASLLFERRRRRAAERAMQAQRANCTCVAAGDRRRTDGIDRARDQPAAGRDPEQCRNRRDAARVGRPTGATNCAQIVADIRRDDLRASEVIRRLRALLARHEVEREPFDLNEPCATRSVAARRGAAARHDARASGPRAQGASVLGDPSRSSRC